jgi:hypothetical protein
MKTLVGSLVRAEMARQPLHPDLGDQDAEARRRNHVGGTDRRAGTTDQALVDDVSGLVVVLVDRVDDRDRIEGRTVPEELERLIAVPLERGAGIRRTTELSRKSGCP